MNRWVGVGRLTKDVETRYTQGQNSTAVARYTVAVDRRGQAKEGEPTADFIPCVCFGKAAEFAGKWFTKGMRVAVEGRIQTRSYKDREGKTVYTWEVVIDGQEFAQSRNEAALQSQTAPAPASSNDFMSIPDGVEDAGLPFN